MKSILSQGNKNIHALKCSIAKKFAKRFLLACIGCTILIHAHSQADKRLVQAELYFASGNYYTAASLYKQFLNPIAKTTTPGDFPLNSKRNTEGKTGKYGTKTDILFKQAESYRLANYWPEASTLYKEYFEKDSAKYAAGLYWYAVCQRSLGNYAIAEECLDRFLNNYASATTYQQEAAKEKQTIQFIKTQVSRPDSMLYRIQKVNTAYGSEKGIFAPAATNKNQYLITSTQTDAVVVAGINPYHNRLFYATFANGSFQTMEPVSVEGVDAAVNQGAATMSANGQYLYFTQWKREMNGTKSAIYISTKKENGWSVPVSLSSINQPGSNSKQPFYTSDGKYLFFASDRTGGQGNFDIWFAPLKPDGTTGEPINAGSVLNSPGNEQTPFYHSTNQTLVFSSDKKPGMGGYDLFSSKGWETVWQVPENLGYPINSSRDDIYFYAPENGALLHNAIFSSDRGSDCCLALYNVSKATKKKKSTGVILDCKDNQPVAGAAVMMTDASGKTWNTITGEDGKYSFELTGDIKQEEILITKDKYNAKNENIIVEGINETAWLTDMLQNSSVCIEKKLVIKIENVVTVYFDFDKSSIKERGVAQLDSIYNVLAEDTTATIQISGYTDGLGTVEYNSILSDKRARACADYLILKGIDATRISFESFGACCPIEMELLNGRDNPDGRTMNRRALINISKE